MSEAEEDAQTAALQEYLEDNRPAGYGASFRAGWGAGRDWQRLAHAAQVQELRAALETIARGTWTAPNSIETIVYVARRALASTPAGATGRGE